MNWTNLEPKLYRQYPHLAKRSVEQMGLGEQVVVRTTRKCGGIKSLPIAAIAKTQAAALDRLNMLMATEKF